MKVRNWSPYTITLNYSLVSEEGSLDEGFLEIPSMWNYTSSAPIDNDLYEWFAFPMIDNQNYVEEKFGEQNFRVLSEMRILAKIRVVILDFCRVSRFFYRNLARNRILGFRGEGN